MALQTSGQISLNDIHVEAGGTTGTLASINDVDIRALIGKSAGVQMSFSEWYGASAVTNWASTMTVGNFTFKGVASAWGYNRNVSSYGSLTDDTIDNLEDDFALGLNWAVNSGDLILLAQTTDTTDTRGNTGFNTLTIGSSNFARTSASYTFNSGSSRRWLWASVTNPFGTTVGATRSISMS